MKNALARFVKLKTLETKLDTYSHLSDKKFGK